MIQNEKEKSIIAQTLTGKVIKKYKFMKKTSDLINNFLQRKYLTKTKFIFTRNNVKRRSMELVLRNAVQEFFEKDENSIMAPTTKDTIKKFQVTKRKIYLQDIIHNLYTKFCSETSNNIC